MTDHRLAGEIRGDGEPARAEGADRRRRAGPKPPSELRVEVLDGASQGHVREQGKMDEGGAKQYIQNLSKNKRYQRDVY